MFWHDHKIKSLGPSLYETYKLKLFSETHTNLPGKTEEAQ